MERIIAASTLIVPLIVGLVAPSFLRGIGFVIGWAAITGLMEKMPLEIIYRSISGGLILLIVLGIRSFAAWLFRSKTLADDGP